MAGIVKKYRAFQKTPLGRVLDLAVYALMLIFVLIYFTGNGVFIYEAF